MDDRKSNKFLSVKDLTVEYTLEGKTVHAVNKVSLELEAGKTLALVGETGAGKTSIAKAILRILPNPPAKITSGEIYLEGNDLLKLKDFISSLDTVDRVELLPYHNLGEYKWKELGFKYPLEGIREANDDDINRAKEILGI